MLGALIETDAELGVSPEQFSDALAKTNRAKSKRNLYVHNPIVFDEDRGQYVVTQISARRRVKVTSDFVSVDSLREVVVEIAEANRSLSRLFFGQDTPPEM